MDRQTSLPRSCENTKVNPRLIQPLSLKLEEVWTSSTRQTVGVKG